MTRSSQHYPHSRFRDVPSEIQRVFDEAVAAYNAGARLLVLAGCRMVLEGVCNHKKVSRRATHGRLLTLAERVALLQSDFSLLPVSSENPLIKNLVRDVNAAIHRLEIKRPDEVELHLMEVELYLKLLGVESAIRELEREQKDGPRPEGLEPSKTKATNTDDEHFKELWEKWLMDEIED